MARSKPRDIYRPPVAEASTCSSSPRRRAPLISAATRHRHRRRRAIVAATELATTSPLNTVPAPGLPPLPGLPALRVLPVNLGLRATKKVGNISVAQRSLKRQD